MSERFDSFPPSTSRSTSFPIELANVERAAQIAWALGACQPADAVHGVVELAGVSLTLSYAAGSTRCQGLSA